MKKLLNQPLRVFARYAFLVLVCSIPAYYFIVDFIWLHEIDEHNRLVVEQTKKNLEELSLEGREFQESLSLWSVLHPETRLEKVDRLRPDSMYNIYKRGGINKREGLDRFEGLTSYFELHGQPYRISIESNIEESYETIVAITVVTALFFVILLGGAIFLNKRISQKLWLPFYKTLIQVKAFDLTAQRPIVFEASDIHEFTEMNESIRALVDGNIRAYRQQKEFTENASHELQTPLAIVQSKLDLLMQTAVLSDRQASIIEDAGKALSRVSRINRNLLLLAKIENRQFADQENLDLAVILAENVDLLSDFLEDKNLHLIREIQDGVTLEGNRLLLDILLTNLLMNAVRHSPPGAEILVKLTSNSLVVANSGKQALLTGQLFKRFSSVSSETPGTGLGLAIVKEIAGRYHWKVGYEFSEGMHYFMLYFRS